MSSYTPSEVCISTIVIICHFPIVFRPSGIRFLRILYPKVNSSFLTVTLPQIIIYGQFWAYQVYLLSDTAFELRLSHYTDTPMGYNLYTCFFNLYDLRALTIVFQHQNLSTFFTMLIGVHLSLAILAFLSPSVKYHQN